VTASTVLPRTPNPAATAPAAPLWTTWRPPPGLPSRGAVTQVAIPATSSGFRARQAWIYLPPAYLTPVRPRLPVLVLIGGQPGSSRDWLDAGKVAERMDTWAGAHGGLAPVVVLPDALGSQLANPLCMDSALGRVDTYLSRDVPTWAVDAIQVDTNHAHWAVGGFSYGGTCALQLATAHPALFPTFYDASGQQKPTLGDDARTVAAAFGGDRAAYDAVDPLHQMATRNYAGSAGYLVVGSADPRYRAQGQAVAAAARAAGMSITYKERPGSHNWGVAGSGLTDALPWLATRMGLTP
jgi:S-formylglutathione hydrolase FrmB